jgi:leucyl-tRNA synthetase
MSSYDFAKIESKWQRTWESNRTFRSQVPGEEGFDPSRPKFYVLDMFPYPSGVGLHVGHPLGYIATDIVSRYKRMRGFNVLHPMGFDAFGLPAEQYAIEHGVHPASPPARTSRTCVNQLQADRPELRLGPRVSTTDVGYYRWTQWIFLRLFTATSTPRRTRRKPIDLVAMLEGGDYLSARRAKLVRGGIETLTPWAVRRWGTTWHELAPEQQRAFIDAIAWRTWRRCRSTGAPHWGPCWPTKR